MRRLFIAVFATLFAAGCSGVVVKNFKVFADPPDAVISVISGPDLTEEKYRSPATISARIPKDPALAAKAVLEVRRDDYRPRVISLSDIRFGETLNIRLEELVLNRVGYELKFRMKSPALSDNLSFRDDFVACSFIMGDRSFQMSFSNLRPGEMKILWERAEYTDVNGQPHRVMPSNVRFQDRNNILPDQIVAAHGSMQQAVIPIDSVSVSRQARGGYEIRPLFVLDSDAAAGLKGKLFNLFIPVEYDRSIIPYNFKFEIADSVKKTEDK
jgi:hypothetical protein